MIEMYITPSRVVVVLHVSVAMRFRRTWRHICKNTPAFNDCLRLNCVKELGCKVHSELNGGYL